MEQLLVKMARQLDAIDEASLMGLWEKYANIVSQFEPTKRWEEATLVFSLIQAKHMKNQLFNHNWASHVRPDAPQVAGTQMPSFEYDKKNEVSKKADVLSFSLNRPHKG